MTDTLKADVGQVLKEYLTCYGWAGELGLSARLATAEQSQYEYLPNPSWMSRAGYLSPQTGLYLFAKYADLGIVHRISVLSQTTIVLLFRDEYFVASQSVTTDKQLVDFLLKHRFPAP
jgi:hypothetical protein